MAKDGGLSTYSGNKAGAAYGVGYCDAQCPQDLKFINGQVYLPYQYERYVLIGWIGKCRRMGCIEWYWQARVMLRGNGYLGGQFLFDSLYSPFRRECIADYVYWGPMRRRKLYKQIYWNY